MWEKILSNAWPYCSPYFLTYNICKGPNLLKMEIKVAGWDRCIFKKRLGETIKPAGKGQKGAISLFKSSLNKMFQVKKRQVRVLGGRPSARKKDWNFQWHFEF